DQIVEHAALRADVPDSARLMHVEMRRAIEDTVTQHASPLWTGLRCRHLKLRAVVLHRNIGREAEARRQAVCPDQRSDAVSKHIAARPTVTRGLGCVHDAASSLWVLLLNVVCPTFPGNSEAMVARLGRRSNRNCWPC